MPDELPRKTVREWRRSRYLTQAELAEKIGVELHTIYAWEVGRKLPRFKNMRALAAFLEIHPDQIILEPAEETLEPHQ